MKSKEERVYDSLKQKLLNANYTSNSLLEKSETVIKEDSIYLDKIEKIRSYLLEKITHGDGIAYALLYPVYKDVINKFMTQTAPEKFLEFLDKSKFSADDVGNEFFDPKVAYVAKDLSDSIETLGTHQHHGE